MKLSDIVPKSEPINNDRKTIKLSELKRQHFVNMATTEAPRVPSIAETVLQNPIFRPLVKEETIKKSPIAKTISGILPVIQQFQGLPRQGFLTPKTAVEEGVSQVSAQTSPLAIASTPFILGGVAKEAGILPRAKVPFSGISKNIKNVAKPASFAKEVRQSVFDKKQALGKALDKDITILSESNPTELIDLRDPMYQLKASMIDVENNPGLALEVNQTLRKIKDPKLASRMKTLIDNPETAASLSLREAEDIKRAISQSPTLSKKSSQGKFANWTSGDIEMLDLVDEIKAAQAEKFPQLSELRTPYAEFMNDYRLIKNQLRPGRLIDKLKGKFGDEEIEQAAKRAIPKKTYKDIKSFRRTRKAIKWGAGIATIGGGGAIGGALVNR